MRSRRVRGEASPRRPVRSARRTLQDDLRARGLPLVIEGSVRRRALLARTSPVFTASAVALLAGFVADQAAEELMSLWSEAQPLDSETNPWLLVLFVASTTALCSPIVGWLVALVLPRLRPGLRTALGVVMVSTTLFTSGPVTLPYRIAFVVAVLAGTYWGMGTILQWTARRSLRELGTLGPMVSRVLPLLMLTFLFFFFNAEIWQLAAKLDVGRAWGAVGVITAMAVVLTVVNARDELQETFEVVGADEWGRPLRPAERLNILLVTVLVTMMQFLILGMLVFCFFLLFGILSVPEATAQLWMGEPPQRLDGLLGRIPMSTALLKVCLVLAAFSGLNFVAGASADRAYRATFVEPVLSEVEEGLRVRAAYLSAPS